MKLLTTLALLLGACGPGGKGYVPPPTWGAEDLIGMWTLIPDDNHPVLIVEFVDDEWDIWDMYSEVRLRRVWDVEWNRIRIFASHGDVTSKGIVDFGINFRDAKVPYAYFEGAMDEDKLGINGMVYFWGDEEKPVGFVAEKL
tara:strand:+ start:338 stop:763 length:426 start_codon:yes stop_codon:yes gene_type:complete